MCRTHGIIRLAKFRKVNMKLLICCQMFFVGCIYADDASLREYALPEITYNQIRPTPVVVRPPLGVGQARLQAAQIRQPNSNVLACCFEGSGMFCLDKKQTGYSCFALGGATSATAICSAIAYPQAVGIIAATGTYGTAMCCLFGAYYVCPDNCCSRRGNQGI
jgi:hypothetical protein